ncbi:MAG TPA: hypothetical protein VF290_09975 [Pyrinomonadaceae bacterium]
MTRRNQSGVLRKKVGFFFSLLFTLLLSSILYADFPSPANAEAETSEHVAGAAADRSKSTTAGCCGEDGNNKPHPLAGSYYTINNNFSAKLLLNNKGPLPIEVQPTLFSLNGDRFDAQPVIVDANSHRFEDFADWAAIAGEQFREGSIHLFHRGKDLVLGAQIYLTDETHSLSFDEKLTELRKPGSSRLAGVWWLPSPKGEVNLVLSNTTSTMLSVSTTIRGESPKRESGTTVDVGPHETKVLNIERDLFRREQGAMSSFGAISIEHNGASGTLLARAMALYVPRGFSLPIQFTDPATAKSNNLQGAGLRLASIARESLSPTVVVHNAGGTETTLNGRVPYAATGGSEGDVILPQVKLSPGETKVIDIALYVKAHGVSSEVTAAGLEFQYTGELGSVITSAFSVSRSGNQVFRVPLWDIAAQRSGTGGYPWYIEGDSSTVIYIKNVTDETQNYRMYLKFSGGDYVFPLTSVAPHQTTVIDVRKLRDTQVPDVNGQTIPAGETRGQVQWSLTGGVDRVVIGRSEQVDLVQGISSNYACQNCCPNSFFEGLVTPVQSTGFQGDQLQFIAMQQDANCYGQVYPPVWAGFASYTSSDMSICNPNFNTGMTTGVAPGEAIINAGWTADAWFFSTGGCGYSPVEVLREALCEVLAVRFLKASEPGTSNSADFNQFNSANLNTSSCSGLRFSIKATFQLPQFSAGCCNNPLTSFVKLSDDNKFEFAPLPDGTIYDFFGNDSPPHVIVYLRRRANNAGITDSVRIVVSGSYQSGESYTGQGTVHPKCQ